MFVWECLQKFSSVQQTENSRINRSIQDTLDPQIDDGPGSSPSPTVYTSNFLRWFIRLHFALFCLNKKYPTILTHRLLSIRMRSESFPLLNYATRPSFQLVGFLILLESMSDTMKGGFHCILRVYYSLTLRLSRERIRRQLLGNETRRQSQMRESNILVGSHARQRLFFPDANEPLTFTDNSFHAIVEQKVPSAIQSPRILSQDRNRFLSTDIRGIPSNHNITCGICMDERTYPATIPCGHVFCWKCIQHWCTYVRQECPLCRSYSQPQNIISLNGYS